VTRNDRPVPGMRDPAVIRKGRCDPGLTYFGHAPWFGEGARGPASVQIWGVPPADYFV